MLSVATAVRWTAGGLMCVGGDKCYKQQDVRHKSSDH